MARRINTYRVFYNDTDRFCCDWLSNLIDRGVIAPGTIDDRPIQEITPSELQQFTQCHFFAGIGVWSYALRLAGWPDDRPVWTGSCPCQPFSTAGAGAGFVDERHLWPYWHHLIRVCRPPVVFGEQVASKDAFRWLDLVQADLEGEGYAVGAADLCAAGIGAPHIRQRLWFVADAGGQRRQQVTGSPPCDEAADGGTRWHGRETDLNHLSASDGEDRYCELANASGYERRTRRSGETNEGAEQPTGRCDALVLGHTGVSGLARRSRSSAERTGRAIGGFWGDAEWVYCHDEKYRPVEPGTFPLAHGAPARVGRLRAYGNAIVAPLAAKFIRAYVDVREPFDDN